MVFEKVTALGGTAYRCLLFDSVTVAAGDFLDSEAFPMPAATGEYSLHITSITDDGAANFICTGSNIPGESDIEVVAGASPIAEGQTSASAPSLVPFTLMGVLYPRVRIVNTSATDPITVTAYLAIAAVSPDNDPTDYTTHIAVSDLLRRVKRRYKSPVADMDFLDIVNDLLRDIALKSEYFRSQRTVNLSTAVDEYRVSDDLRWIEKVYNAKGALLPKVSRDYAARQHGAPWWTVQGTVDAYMVDGVTVGCIRPFPLPDTEDQTLTVHYIEAPSPISYMTAYVPIHRMFTNVLVEYITAQLYADENDSIDLRKEQYRMLSYFKGRIDITAQAASNASGEHNMPYRGI